MTTESTVHFSFLSTEKCRAVLLSLEGARMSAR